MSRRKVLITGAAGYIAGILLPVFKRRYDLVLVDISNVGRGGSRVDGITIADLSDPDRTKYAGLFAGVDAVVHLGHKPREGEPLDHYGNDNVNVRLAYNVLRTSYDAGVRRVVVASSGQADNWHIHNPIRRRQMEVSDPQKMALADAFYGVGKVATEHMGFLFACGVFGRRMGAVNIRIGAPHEFEAGIFKGDAVGHKRNLGAYISRRDLVQLFSRAVDTPNIDNEHGVPWHVFDGISDNTRATTSLANARRVLGYRPQDDSEVRYADDIRRHLTGPGSTGRVGTE